MDLKAKLKKIFTLRTILGIIIGTGVGYGFYYFTRCSDGSCPLKSNPTFSMLWGGVLGFVLLYRDKPERKNEHQQDESLIED